MTIEEARSHIGRGVAYRSGTDEAEEYVILDVSRHYVFARPRSHYDYKRLTSSPP